MQKSKMSDAEYERVNSIIVEVAKKIVNDYDITSETKEAFLNDTDTVVKVREELDKVRGLLMNYDDYQQDYIDSVIDEIDALFQEK